MRLIDSLYSKVPSTLENPTEIKKRTFDGLTFVIVAFNMLEQLKRTLTSCSSDYQQAAVDEIEIIIVDNGSDIPLRIEDFSQYPNVSKVIRMNDKPSPVFGLNEGIRQAEFSNVALMIDGAHLLSPGVFRNAKSILQNINRPVISIPQYIFGPDSQNIRNIKDAFSQETAYLNKIDWPSDGYKLFDYAVLPGEHFERDIYGAVESNCLITTKTILEDSGGFDERFCEPGGELANLEIYIRLSHEPRNEYVVLAGEGTFHQDHHGITTGADIEKRQALVEKYLKRYSDFTGNERLLQGRPPFYYGIVRHASRNIPTISTAYGDAKRQILKQLADIYIKRVQYGQSGDVPSLTLQKTSQEHRIRPDLKPLGILERTASAQNTAKASLNYLSIIKKIHQTVQPKLYFEIGVDKGKSISLARCVAVGVDPSCEITSSLFNPTQIFRITSDEFFNQENRCTAVLGTGIDLAFIDGMHLAEYVVRDFINVEKWSKENSVIILDDVFPEQMEMSLRTRDFDAWCGDVYKTILILLKYRPELKISVFEAFIGPYRKGIAVISNLDRHNVVLQEHYTEIADDILGGKFDVRSIDELKSQFPIRPIRQLEKLLPSANAPS
ncbi:MAG: glycosyltransferase [Deltaproteobacteria bacterium]|nr:glycosyltransferase [Deltaproteobacteria bacterium]MBN2673890.1 glycosyltransferase [Deltaproteobacteria bacterium]